MYKGFIKFVREQGVVGLAIGFILGQSTNKVVSSLVNDILQPFIGLWFGADGLAGLQYRSIMYGKFIVSIIDFVLIAAVVYFVFRGLKLQRLDASKEDKK